MKQKLLADIAHQTNSVEQGETQPLKKPKKTNRINQDTNDGVFPLILDLYAPINARIADITYGKGVFWKHIDTSKYEVFFTDLKRDGLPKQCVGGIDSQRLPYEDSYLDVVVFDPPYMHTPGGTAHNGHQNYEQYYKNNSEQDAEIVKKIWEETGGNPPKYHEAVLDLYFRTADEAWRVLAEDGVFIVKCQDEPDDDILKKIAHQAEAKYQIRDIVKKYIESVEEIINIPRLVEIFEKVLESGYGAKVIEEIVLQSRVEFNTEAEEQDVLGFEKSESSA